MTTIKTKQFILRPFKIRDAVDLAKNINDKTIYRNTFNIPYPYTLKDAKNWLSKTLRENRKKKPKRVSFAIEIDHEVVGSVGLHKIEEGHKAEIGYWLARKYWGKGIMTNTVKEITKFGFDKLELKRIYGYTFPFNRASMRVLEKCGYKLEGILKKHAKKKNKFLDDYLFAKTK